MKINLILFDNISGDYITTYTSDEIVPNIGDILEINSVEYYQEFEVIERKIYIIDNKEDNKDNFPIKDVKLIVKKLKQI